MDIIKDPRITKGGRAAVCLFAFLSIIGAFVFLFSSTRNAAMVLAMTIVTFVFSLAAAALAFLSKNNFIFSVVGAGLAVFQFVLGIILGATLSISGRIRIYDHAGGYFFATIIFIILSGLIAGVNVIGIFAKDEKSFINSVRNMSMQSQPQQMMNAAQAQTQMMMQQMQQMQPNNMMGQPGIQQTTYMQPNMMPQQYPQQGQQGYPRQMQQGYPQQSSQQPYPQQQGQQVYPQQNQQYQQPNNFNQQ